MSAYTEFFDELVRFEIDLWGRLDQLLKEQTSTSVAQLQSLRAIAARGGDARVQDVADELQITVGAGSKLVDRLERDGLAARAVHPTDRRSMVIALTPAGETALRQAVEAADRNLQELLTELLTEQNAAELALAFSSMRSGLRTGSHVTGALS